MVVFTICSNNLLLLLTQANRFFKLVSTKRDNYLLTLMNCTEAHVQCNLRQITFKIFWLTFKNAS